MSKVLFLCTGNSCRSQLAEALLRHHAGGQFEAFSAGTAPQPIHPMTLQVLSENGVDTSGLESKSLRTFLGQQHFGFIVTVCDQAAKECPTAWPGVQQRIAMSFDDPAAFEGTPEEALARFRDVRDQIEAAVLEFIREHGEQAQQV